jgi:glycosyltransferase involved in cell wall biosynthesis
LVFLGQPGYIWHGTDKLIYLAFAFPDWRFDLVGLKPEEIVGKIPDNLVFHGMLERSEYEQILRQANCSIGTLALNRNNMEEASPLKTREYLAYGLPVIIGYSDTDFPQGADFLLQLPNTEDNVKENIEGIRKFVLAWKDKRVPREAVRHLDWSYKEARRLDFFKSLVNYTMPVEEVKR